LRAATAIAVKNNVSIYPLDVRGLQLFLGREARNASLQAVRLQRQRVFNDLNTTPDLRKRFRASR